MFKRVTVKEVASRAGVSVTTVSWVVRGGAGGNVRISPATRARVEQVIEDLGYRPSAVARNLRAQRTQLLAAMVPDLTNPFFPQMIRGAQETAERDDYQLAVYDTHGSHARERAFVTGMLDRRADGVMLVPLYLTDGDVAELVAAGLSVVTTGAESGVTAVDVVTEDLAHAAEVAMAHLLELGHTRIAHLAGPQDVFAGRVRLEVYRQAIEATGTAPDDRLVRFGDFTASGVGPAVDALMRLEDPPTAIFAANDQMAIAALKQLRRRGVDVPSDVSVVGIDNIPDATSVDPELTTVDLDPVGLGRLLARTLVARIQTGTNEPGSRTAVRGGLVVRGSTRRVESTGR